MQEQWNNAARRREQRAHVKKGTRARDGWEARPHLGRDGDGKKSITAACGLLSQYGYDGNGRRGQERTRSHGSSNRREVEFDH
jgi:hypothetical protein